MEGERDKDRRTATVTALLWGGVTERERERERERESERARETQRETDRETERVEQAGRQTGSCKRANFILIIVIIWISGGMK